MTEDRGKYEVKGERGPRRETRLPFADPRYQEPTPEEIRYVLRELGWTGSIAGEQLGVNGRTIRKWTGGEAAIPYSAWRLMLVAAGLALEGDAVRRVAEKR